MHVLPQKADTEDQNRTDREMRGETEDIEPAEPPGSGRSARMPVAAVRACAARPQHAGRSHATGAQDPAVAGALRGTHGAPRSASGGPGAGLALLRDARLGRAVAALAPAGSVGS